MYEIVKKKRKTLKPSYFLPCFSTVSLLYLSCCTLDFWHFWSINVCVCVCVCVCVWDLHTKQFSATPVGCPKFSSIQVMVLEVKNLPANAENIKAVGSIPGFGRSPEEGMATHSSILAWRISMGRDFWQATRSQRDGHDWSNLTLTSIQW